MKTKTYKIKPQELKGHFEKICSREPVDRKYWTGSERRKQMKEPIINKCTGELISFTLHYEEDSILMKGNNYVRF